MLLLYRTKRLPRRDLPSPHQVVAWRKPLALTWVACMMKRYSFWAMILMDAYAILCICLLMALFAGTEMPLFTFTQIRS
jgi:hypothetical protein